MNVNMNIYIDIDMNIYMNMDIYMDMNMEMDMCKKSKIYLKIVYIETSFFN